MQTEARVRPESDLDHAHHEFARWRRGRQRGARIPAALWQMALSAASRHGVSKTSQALHLDYYALQRRLGANTAARPSAPAEFIEVSLPGSSHGPRCQLEIRDSIGAAVRIDLTGLSAKDLATFVRAVAGHDPCCK